MEVELINAATRSYLRDNPTDGLVMGGDLNLVGSYQPVVSLAENLDRNEAALGVVRPYHLNGRSNATWENPDSQFAPGRLDFLLVSESSITAHTAFVFNTKDMSADALSLGELLRSDSREASDHYPIVVDLVWGEAAPQ